MSVFLYLFLPELKGRTLEEIDELFQNRVSVRDFPNYECVSSEQAKQAASKVMDAREHPGGEKSQMVVESRTENV